MSFTFRSSVQPHVLGQIVDFHCTPQRTSGNRGTNNLLAQCPGYNRECLAKVTSKQNSNSPKRLGCFTKKISQEMINRCHSMLVLHRNFIPDNYFCLLQDLMHEGISLDPCYRCV